MTIVFTLLFPKQLLVLFVHFSTYPHPHTLNCVLHLKDFQKLERTAKPQSNNKKPNRLLLTYRSLGASMETGPRSLPGSTGRQPSVFHTDLETVRESILQLWLRPQPPVSLLQRADSRRAAPWWFLSLCSLWAQLPIDATGCSCFTKISRHDVCPVAAAQQTGLGGNPASYPCTEQGPEFPDCCPKATGNGTGGLLLRQEKEGVSSLPPTLTNDLIPPFGMWGHQLRRIEFLMKPLTKCAQNTE